jgi:hypothetical protein
MCSWAEGAKRRNAVLLSNADPDLLVVFRAFLRDCYAVVDEQIALTVNCHLGNGLTIDDIHTWWLARLDLPELCLRTPAVNRVSSASKRRKGHVLPYGTAQLGVHSTFIVSMKVGVWSSAGCGAGG